MSSVGEDIRTSKNIKKRITIHEKKVREYYDHLWLESTPGQICYDTLSFHGGFFEKGITTLKEAMLNMNDFVGRLLLLDKKRPRNVLDAGCGIGGTSIHLAKKYPDIGFTGITISPVEVDLACKYAKERKISNSTFILGNYLDTGLPDNSFMGVFALESMEYAQDKKDFLREMYRVLAPGGKIVVIGGFRTDRPLHSFTRKLYRRYQRERGFPDLINIHVFRSYLEKEGFKEVNIMNLNANLRWYVLLVFFKQLPVLVSSIVKRVKESGDPRSSERIGYFLGAVVLDLLFGVCGIFEYDAITAIKRTLR